MLIHAEGFNIYGPDAARLLDRVYSQATACSLSTVNPRTGLRHLRIQAGANNSGLRHPLGFERDVVGIGLAMHINELPTNSRDFAICQFRSTDNENMLTIGVSSTGELIATEGGRGGSELGPRSAQVIRAGAYQHVEVRWERGTTSGTVEVRVNGVTRLNLTDIDTTNGLDAACAQIFIGLGGLPKTGAAGIQYDVDDLIVWDDTGDDANDFIGDKKCYTRLMASDGAENDWEPITGSNRAAMVSNVPPEDASAFIFATGDDLPERQTFLVDDFPSEIVAVAGVSTYARLWKTDAGDARVLVGVISDATEAQGAEHPLDQAPGWYEDVFVVDPATGAPWTLGALNDMLASLERTV